MRYILLDRISELTPEKAVGVKCVSLSDDLFVDHFPGHPIMPGAMILESMAQIGGVLVEAIMRDRGRTDVHALLVQADRLKFRKMVRPGDSIRVEAQNASVKDEGGRVTTTAKVDGKLVAEGELTFAFTEVKNPVVLARRREILNLWLHGSTEEA